MVQSTLLQILSPFRIALQLQLVEGNRLLQQLGIRSGRQFLPQMRNTLAEWQVQEQFDEADQIAAAPTSVTVKQILAGIDIERRAAFPMQRTQPNKLLRRTGAAGSPVVPLQVFQQRKALFEPFQILAHGGCFSSRVKRRRRTAAFPGEDGGLRSFFQSRKGQNRSKQGNRVCQRSRRSPRVRSLPASSA